MSQSSHHSARSTASYNSRRSGYGRHSGAGDDEYYDSAVDSEEEERRRRRHERHRRRREEKSREEHRPTLGDSMYALFGELKNAMKSDKQKD